MERERKYRAWDGRKMYYASLDDLIFSMGSQGAGDWTIVEQVGEELAGFAGRLPGQTTMIYMNGIGMIDKHGKDIYEGDIVKADWHWTEPHAITWPHDCYWFQEVSLEGDNLEVIGNIHDNPELLL